ncbi:MAG: hypothetical protein HC887_05030 [Desulfobacteraceae bacterium]|nr:hypothetical protein [Desulfobacteraceae bacterium]
MCDNCLMDGNLRLKDMIVRNIDGYMKQNRLMAYGLKLHVSVRTEKGTVIYPEIFTQTDVLQPNSVKTASENYDLANQGIVLAVEVILDHNTALSNAMLAFYILLFLGLLYPYYRSAIRKADAEEEQKNKEIERLSELGKAHAQRLEDLEFEKENLAAEFSRIKNILETEKRKASQSEDQLLEEIIALEKKMKDNLALQEEQTQEIEALKDQIGQHEKSRTQGKKDFNVAYKRFRNLYKNLIFHDRALSGFADLADEFKIKGEEIIYQLNENPELVPIKRKVFNKRGNQTVFEVVFAYRGRLYFRRMKDNKIEIVIIGSKNSQIKDLEFINHLE